MSYRALSRHPDLEVSHSRLWQSTRIAVQYDQLPIDGRDLGFTHHRALLRAPDAETRDRLAMHAVRLGWTANELHQRIQASRTQSSEAGRPPAPTFQRALRGVQAANEALAGSDAEALFRGLNGGEVGGAVQAMRAEIATLGREVRRAEALARDRST